MMINNQIMDLWMFCAVQKPHLLILANLQSNKRQNKETIRFSHRFFAYMHLSKRKIFHSYIKSFHIFYLSWSIILNKELKNVGLFGQVSGEKLVTVADFKRHPRQKYGNAQRFFWWFSEMKWLVIKGNQD